MPLPYAGRLLRTSALVALAFFAACTSEPPEEPSSLRQLDVLGSPNPDLGGAEIGDPHMIKVGDTYWLYASTSTKLFEAFSSTDLVHWTSVGPVWRPTPGTWTEPGDAWAPSVHPGDGGFYMYYALWRRIGVAFSTSPAGPFVDVLDHPLVGGGYGGVGDGIHADGADKPDNFNDYDELTIDPFVLVLPDGRKFLYFVRYTPLSVISVLEMKDFTTLLDEHPTDVLVPDQGWERLVNEAPWVEYHDGNIALMYSGNFVRTEDYAIGVAMGTDPRGPFRKSPDNPWLGADKNTGLHGPGHHSVTVDTDGHPLLVFHSDVDVPGLSQPMRRVFTQRMSFDAAGVPVLGR